MRLSDSGLMAVWRQVRQVERACTSRQLVAAGAGGAAGLSRSSGSRVQGTAVEEQQPSIDRMTEAELSMCRTCLNSQALGPLFPQPANYRSVQLALRLCTGLQMDYNDGLPQYICVSCKHIIDTFLLFRYQSRAADERLRNIMNGYATNSCIDSESGYIIPNPNNLSLMGIKIEAQNKVENFYNTKNSVPTTLYVECSQMRSKKKSLVVEKSHIPSVEELTAEQNKILALYEFKGTNKDGKKTNLLPKDIEYHMGDNNDEIEEEEIGLSDCETVELEQERTPTKSILCDKYLDPTPLNEIIEYAKTELKKKRLKNYTESITAFKMLKVGEVDIRPVQKSEPNDAYEELDKSNKPEVSPKHERVHNTRLRKITKDFNSRRVQVDKPKLHKKVTKKRAIKRKQTNVNLDVTKPTTSPETKTNKKKKIIRKTKKSLGVVLVMGKDIPYSTVTGKVDGDAEEVNKKIADPELMKNLEKLLLEEHLERTARNKGAPKRSASRKKKKEQPTVKINVTIPRQRHDPEFRSRCMELVEGPYDASTTHFQCKVCKALCKGVRSFEQHAQIHIGFKHLCEFCAKGQPSRAALKLHLQAKHGMAREHRCTFCDFMAVDRAQLRVHERKTHTKERPFVCHQCGAGFFSKPVLRQHIAQSHREEKPYQCDECPRRFKLLNQRNYHKKMQHHPTFNFLCHICNYTFLTTQSVRSHFKKIHKIPRDQQVAKIRRVYFNQPISEVGSERYQQNMVVDAN